MYPFALAILEQLNRWLDRRAASYGFNLQTFHVPRSDLSPCLPLAPYRFVGFVVVVVVVVFRPGGVGNDVS